MSYNLNNKKFKPLSKSNIGDVNNNTVFKYHQDGETIWAEYHGGDIEDGKLIGKVEDNNTLFFIYKHKNRYEKVMRGKCKTNLSINKSGQLILDETWQWTNGDLTTGNSLLIEVL